MLLVMAERRTILDRLYDAVCAHCDESVIHRLSRDQHLNLGYFLASVEYKNFDRVVMFSRLKWLRSQISVLSCVPGLVFVEHDAWQNYMVASKYFNAYAMFYQRLPWARVLVSGTVVARKLRDEGIDSSFVSKGYDETMLRNLDVPRDIPVGFLGSLKSSEYTQRKEMLEGIAAGSSMVVKRTESGQEYLETLNRIKIFVSADIGMGEYMIKNFEAMACGCVLLTWSQGEEDDLLGFEDMKNVIFYRSQSEAIDKIKMLEEDPQLASRIARTGQAFTEQNYTFSKAGRDLAHHIQQDMRIWQRPSLTTRLWVRLRYDMRVPELDSVSESAEALARLGR